MTNPEKAVCPVDHQEYLTQTWMEGTSQAILDEPDGTEVFLYDLKARLEDHYSVMAENKPGKAAVNIARKVRSAARGPVAAILNAYAVDIYNGIDFSEQQELVARCAKDNTEYRSNYFNALYTGNAEPWMRTLVYLQDEATFLAIHEDKQLEPIFSNIKKTDAFIFDSLVEAYKLNNDEQAPVKWSEYDLDWDIAESSRDNRAALYRVLFATYLALAESGEIDPGNPNQLTNALLENIEPLSRLTSINRKTSGEFLPRFTDPDSEYPPRLFEIGGEDTEILSSKFVYENGILRPLHASIQEKSWRAPGNCPAYFKLRLPSEKLTAGIDDFFDRVGHPEHGTDRQNRFMLAGAFIALGLEIGRHSLFKPQNSPVLARFALNNS